MEHFETGGAATPAITNTGDLHSYRMDAWCSSGTPSRATTMMTMPSPSPLGVAHYFYSWLCFYFHQPSAQHTNSAAAGRTIARPNYPPARHSPSPCRAPEHQQCRYDRWPYTWRNHRIDDHEVVQSIQAPPCLQTLPHLFHVHNWLVSHALAIYHSTQHRPARCHEACGDDYQQLRASHHAWT